MSHVIQAHIAQQREGAQVCVFQLPAATTSPQDEQSTGEPVGQLLFKLHGDGRIEIQSTGDIQAMASTLAAILEAWQPPAA
ncbi:hypothetical protein [Chromobacterium sp. ASV23]|uniref:hypothetical protein n=1 Tax=Chromobacterium sp. ASV23 TaxID=2795110 RepID=UPI0018EB2609|nr:hypothetical protein [Chromobacterium sp. ASV23]